MKEQAQTSKNGSPVMIKTTTRDNLKAYARTLSAQLNSDTSMSDAIQYLLDQTNAKK